MNADPKAAERPPIRALRAAALAAHVTSLAAAAEQQEAEREERRQLSLKAAREAVREVLGIHVSDVQLTQAPSHVVGYYPTWIFEREGLRFRVRRDGACGMIAVELAFERANTEPDWLAVRDLAHLGQLIAPAGLK